MAARHSLCSCTTAGPHAALSSLLAEQQPPAQIISRVKLEVTFRLRIYLFVNFGASAGLRMLCAPQAMRLHRHSRRSNWQEELRSG